MYTYDTCIRHRTVYLLLHPPTRVEQNHLAAAARGEPRPGQIARRQRRHLPDARAPFAHCNMLAANLSLLAARLQLKPDENSNSNLKEKSKTGKLKIQDPKLKLLPPPPPPKGVAFLFGLLPKDSELRGEGATDEVLQSHLAAQAKGTLEEEYPSPKGVLYGCTCVHVLCMCITSLDLPPPSFFPFSSL